MKITSLLLFTLICFLNTNLVLAQDKTEETQKSADETALAKAAQNPVGDLISLPFQNNTSFGIGPFDRTQNVLNIQPVIPFSVGNDWNLVTRTIIPIVTQPNIFSKNGSTSGLGDISLTAFLSPKKPGKFIWGIGPNIIFPTGTNENLGNGKWSVGPSVVGLTINGPWVIGLLASNVWSFAGNADRPDVNFLLAQYFVNYNLKKGWYIVSAPIITANWNAGSGEQWIVPFGAGGGKIFKLGKQPMNMTFQSFYNVVTPDYGPKWSMRFQLQLMFPK